LTSTFSKSPELVLLIFLLKGFVKELLIVLFFLNSYFPSLEDLFIDLIVGVLK
jgi:hypothetical protein